MLIDWFTVCAQIVNFLILVWLLKRFLYRPILDAIDAREKRIAQQIAEAERQDAMAQQQQAELKSRSAEFDAERDALMARALEEAQAQKQKLMMDARQEYESLRSLQAETLNRERDDVVRQVTSSTADEVFAIARKTLLDLASTELEERMADVFADRVRKLSAPERRQMAEAIGSSPAPPVIRSGFRLSASAESSIRSALDETLGRDGRLRFETSPQLVSGIELATQGYKISWSIANYLDSLQSVVSTTLKEEHVN